MGTNRASRRPEDADPERTILGEKANHDLERRPVCSVGNGHRAPRAFAGLLKGPELGLVLSASTGGPLGPPGPQHVGQGVSVLLCVVRYQLLGPE